MQFPVVIGLRRSRILPAILIGTGFLAALASLVWSPSPQLGALLTATSALVAAFALRACCKKPPALMFMDDGSLEVADTPPSEFRPVSILPGGVVHPWLTTLRYQEEAGRTVQLVIAVDSIAAEDFRRLRVLLRWQPRVSDAGVPL